MSQLAEDLKAAKALIDTPEKWHRGWYADGDKHCALGAVHAVCDSPDKFTWFEGGRADDCRLALLHALPTKYWRGEGVAAFNDSRRRKHDDIMALFDRAIAAAEAQS
jgi:hypothetical protein